MLFSYSRRTTLRQVATLIAAVGSVSADASDKLFPDVLKVKVIAINDEKFDFDVTVSSPYDSPKRYADGFRVVTKQGQRLGERRLLHDHQNEQPFIRELYGVRIPKHVRHVVVQARDQVNGYGGKSVEVSLPGR